jgi:hypothetical protein
MSRTSSKTHPRLQEPVGFWDLSLGQCRWPTEGNGPVLYCGEPVVAGCSYCSTHRALAYVSPVGRGGWHHFLPVMR